MKIGVAGLGYWGKKVVREYIRLMRENRIDELAIYDIDKSRLLGIDAIPYHSIEKFVDDVDAIHICTNNESHYEFARYALMNKKHVLVEKPLTLDSNQAYKLVELANDKESILQVGHIFRFANVIRCIKRIYEEGYFGKIYYMTFRWMHYNPYNRVDIIWDLSPHPLDILNFITEEWPRDLNCLGIRSGSLTRQASIHAKLNSMLINIELSFLHPLKERIIEIIGSKRSARIDCIEQSIDLYPDDSLYVESNNTIRDEILNFISSCEKSRAYTNSGLVGAKTVSIIEEIIDSMRCIEYQEI